MTGRLDEIEAEALAGLICLDAEGFGPSRAELNSIEADLVLAFAELRAYRALRGGLMGLVLSHNAENDPDKLKDLQAQVGRYYICWINSRENL